MIRYVKPASHRTDRDPRGIAQARAKRSVTGILAVASARGKNAALPENRERRLVGDIAAAEWRAILKQAVIAEVGDEQVSRLVNRDSAGIAQGPFVRSAGLVADR